MEDMERSIQTERGQVLVIMVFGIIVLLVVAGLAVDGGTVLMERRHSQNASDASALAGTRLLAAAICEEPSATDAAILAEVRKLAADNDVRNPATNVTAQYVNQNEAVLGMVGGGSIPAGSTGVSVTIDITRTTYFMMLIGIDTSAASAHALAMTGPIIRFSGGGMLPIAVPLDVVDVLGPDEPFEVIDSSQDGAFCRVDDGYCVGDPSDAASKRGWLNFNYIYNTNFNRYVGDDPHQLLRTLRKSVGNNVCGDNANASTDDGLQGWASGLCPYVFDIYAGTVNWLDGDFIHGSPGARNAALGQIEGLIGQDAYMPIFDYIYTPEDMDENDLPEPVNGIGWPTAGGSENAFLFHIVGFVAVTVDGVDTSDHTLAGTFLEAKVAPGPFEPSTGYGTGACDEMEVFGVALWR